MKTQAITSLPPSPEDDRRSRMIKYTVAMSIRVVCVVLLVFVRGWAMWIIAAGAIILPYIAVVLANVGNTPPQPDVERPGAIVPVGRPARFADEPRGERERERQSDDGSDRADDASHASWNGADESRTGADERAGRDRAAHTDRARNGDGPGRDDTGREDTGRDDTGRDRPAPWAERPAS